MATDTNIVIDPVFGYRRLDPLPSAEELTAFFTKQYFELIRKGERGHEMRGRLGTVAESPESAWLDAALHADIREVLEKEAPGKRCLDVGCGTGDFMHHLRKHNFQVEGVEPDKDMAQRLNKAGLTVHSDMFNLYAESAAARTARFDAVLFKQVLYMAPDPAKWLQLAGKLLNPRGLVFAQIGNDFSEFQLAAAREHSLKPWWVVSPDHIYYFDLPSLTRLLNACGFDVIHAQATFPMELFLLFGENYIQDPELGPRCHARRKSFEMAIPTELRRRLYRSFAELGIGREFLVFAQKKDAL